DQVRQAQALLGVEHRVDLPQRLEHRVAEPLGALESQVPALGCLGVVERLTGDRVGERREGAAAVHFGLSPLDLQVVEDAGEFGNLALIEVELVGQESERPADAESAAAERVVVHFLGVASPVATTGAVPLPAAAA